MAKLIKPKSVVLKPKEADAIITWAYGTNKLSVKEMTKEDCGFAQAVLVELINSSFSMGFLEALLKSALKIPSGPKGVIKSFVKGAGKNYLKYREKDDLEKMMSEPIIYKSCLDQAARATRSAWKIREQTGKLIY